MIIMIFSEAHKTYVPIFYILLSRKQCTYYHAFQQVICASNWQIKAKTVTADFEQALLKAIQYQFPEGPFIGCIFHWKQAIQRKLLDRHISKETISQLMDNDGPINVLTVIPINKIVTKGVPYVRSKTNEVGYEENFNEFWKYFISAWIKKYNPNTWNCIDDKHDEIIVNRTNNPIERYNRTLNALFPNAHPTVQKFVQAIDLESLSFVKNLELI